jgi:hypothetical protein
MARENSGNEGFSTDFYAYNKVGIISAGRVFFVLCSRIILKNGALVRTYIHSKHKHKYEDQALQMPH